MPRQKPSRTRNILRDKGESTEFQILLEVMRSQPHVKQKDVADSVGISVQAVSKHFKKLAKEGLLDVGSERADYRLTPKANDKLSEYLKSLNAYTARIKSDLKVERLLPALATQRVNEGEFVGIIMKEGVLIRDCTSFGIQGYIRVAVRGREENQKLIDALGRALCRD